MKISDIITESNAFHHARLRAQQQGTRDYKIPTVDIVSQPDYEIDYSKSKADILKQLDALPGRLKRPKEKPLPPGSITGFQTSTKPLPSKDHHNKPKTTRGPQNKPRGDDNPQHASGIIPQDSNLDIQALLQQGMSPVEIEQYLHDVLGMSYSTARHLVNDELF